MGDVGGCGARRFFRPLRVTDSPLTLSAWLTESPPSFSNGFVLFTLVCDEPLDKACRMYLVCSAGVDARI